MSDRTADSKTDLTATAESDTAASQLNKAARGALTRIADRANRLFQELVSAGEARNSTGGDGKKAASGDWRARLASALGLPTREEMQSLDQKLNRISRKVNKLAREQKA